MGRKLVVVRQLFFFISTGKELPIFKGWQLFFY
jgi:hypothetical protein